MIPANDAFMRSAARANGNLKNSRGPRKLRFWGEILISDKVVVAFFFFLRLIEGIDFRDKTVF